MFDIDNFMTELAAKRPIFHSEADFQHAFAWQLHEWHETAKIRLEYPIDIFQRNRLDILMTINDVKLAIELKYTTRKFKAVCKEEIFNLKDHAAVDVRRYDFVKDITRLEHLKNKHGFEGYAILMTNNPAYWNIGNSSAIDENFRLHNSRILNGNLGWHERAGTGTTANRQDSLIISGNYTCEWKEYLSEPIYGFQYLALKI